MIAYRICAVFDLKRPLRRRRRCDAASSPHRLLTTWAVRALGKGDPAAPTLRAGGFDLRNCSARRFAERDHKGFTA